ncbi:fibronectin type III domain-containing protein 7 [Bombina bombina]|uniref:fibronectin type III domain-containing protein 7 n=1 Tax=Bombina bombina TaxID=8345 RepID=UPI00235B2BF1|nr:fibronectin type III domain-containing protein 7 [Bombina bombina]
MGHIHLRSFLLPLLISAIGVVASTNTDISVSVYDVTSRSIYVKWSKVTEATSYKITADPVMTAAEPTFAVFNSATTIGTVNTLLPNTSYEVTVEAMNKYGVTIAHAYTVAYTAPDVPSIDQAYSKLSSSITVEWADVPGATGYLLTAQDGEFFYETIVTHSPGTITGLQPDTTYKITVRSVSSAGKSQPSPPKIAKTVLPAVSVAVTSPSSDSLSVSWQPVPSAILYSVSVMRSDGLGNRWNQNTTSLSLNFTMLDPGTIYTIKVHAWEANGTPGDDITYNQITRPALPSDVQITFNSGALEATFTVSGAEATTNYTIFVSDGDTTLNCTTSVLPCSISSLYCGMEYAVSLVASNEAGSTLAPNARNFKSVPCAPSGITIEEEVPGNLSVSWSSGTLSDYYVVFAKRDDGFEVQCNTSQTRCYFPGDCGFIYFMSVFAYNKAGQSPLGDIFNYTTAPCCPSDVSALFVSSDTLEIIWTAVRGAEIYETKADDGENVILCNDTATLCSLSALQCNTQYNVSVYSFSESRGSNTSCASNYMKTAPCSPEIINITKLDTSTYTVYWEGNNEDATYSVSAKSDSLWWNCTGSGTFCSLSDIPCGSVFMVSVVATTAIGRSLPSYTVPLETAPCCPANLSVVQVTQSATNLSWSMSKGAQTYTARLVSQKGEAKCHTMQDHCLLGCITCGTNYSVTLEPTSDTGLTSVCIFHGYSSSACCPSGVKLYRLSSSGIRVTWRASSEPTNYSANMYSSKGNFTCTPSPGVNYCDIPDIPCGDVYTVMVSPVTHEGSTLSFCPKKLYTVTCSGNSLGMVIYRGKRSVR